MTSKEIVRRTLDFDFPERIAYDLVGKQDFQFCRSKAKTHATDWVKDGENHWSRRDEWGNTWERIDPTSKGEVTGGILEEIPANEYELPDFSNYADYAHIEETARTSDKWVVGSMPGFTFNIARKLKRLEIYLMDLLLEPEETASLHDKVDKVLVDMITNYAKAGVDAIMFPEDWGTQTQTLVSPELWYAEFFPRFEKLCGLARSKGLKVMMHSCGAIAAIVPGLIKAGVDLLQFDQPTLHGIDQLAAYQDTAKITFWCPVDIQKTLQTKDEQIIRAEARELIDKLWRGRGGFVAKVYDDNQAIGLEPIWQEIAAEEFIKHGRK